jgi:alanine racemase
VATYGEALTLLKAGIKSDVFILGADETAGEKNFIPTAVSYPDYAKKIKYPRFSVAVNTGMNRYGLSLTELDEISKAGKIQAFSTFSHIFNVNYAYEQSRIFERACGFFAPSSIRHLYASNYPCADKKYDMVRAGIALYGYGIYETERAMTVTARVVRVSFVKAGEHIGYGDYVTPESIEVATINAGYGDGYPRLRAGETRHVVIKGKRVQVIGQVCMDAFFADVSGLKVSEGDEVVLIGDGYDAREAAHERASVEYEVITAFKPRQVIRYK